MMKPIAWMSPDGKLSTTEGKLFYIPLYPAPRELSDEEIKQVIDNISHYGSIAKDDYVSFAKAILKKASEK